MILLQQIKLYLKTIAFWKWADSLKNVGGSMSHNLKGLHDLLQG
jgi:hypothetical protein